MEKHLKTAELFATLLDSRYSLFGFKVGINALIDLVPEAGDIVAALLSLYLIWIAMRMKLPAIKIAHMFWNIFINFIIGLIPFIGDLVYIFHKSNLKNLKIIKDYADKNSLIVATVG